MCFNCNNQSSELFCNWACETCFIIRLEHSAYFNGKLKYPEFLEQRRDLIEKTCLSTRYYNPLQFRKAFLL